VNNRTAVTLSSTRHSPLLAAALTNPIHPRPYDRNEVNDPVTPTPDQRQQQRRPLRKTHIEAASAGISPSPPRVRFAAPTSEQQLTTDFDEGPTSSTPLASSSQQHYSPETERRPHRAVRISKNTASAILYTLEEALRHPNQFTSDLVEENASMSDLTGGGPSASVGNGRSRPQAVPGTTGSPANRTPRDVMRDRIAREQKRREDAERVELERAHAEEEARLIEAEQRRNAERRAAVAAGAAAQQRGSGEGGQRGSGSTTGQRISDNSQGSNRNRIPSGERQQEQSLQGLGRGGRAVGGGEASRPRPAQPQPASRPAENSRTRPAQAQPASAAAGPPEPPPAAQAPGSVPRSSFPHAFERWETLSAHWEGLTSFWIRRLEENSNEINREPISQQLSRQVTDLSAAGANLFHAVVELQRLRASSERKFQRWFFETRAEQERYQEVQALQDRNLEEERQSRAQAIAEAVEHERAHTNKDKQLEEMKRELAIAKEEARRAWEELGNREQEERERTASLREGQPTIVGGVQVVPMMQGVPSRHGSARDPPSQHVPESEGPIDNSDAAYQQYSRAQRAEPADPFVEQQNIATRTERRQVPASTIGTYATSTSSSYAPEYTQAPAVQPASASAFYQQQHSANLHPISPPTHTPSTAPSHGPSPTAASEAAFSEEEYEIDAEGQFVRDARGNKVRYAPEHVISDDEADADEYDVGAARARELAYLQEYGRAPVSGVEYGRPGPSTTVTAAPGRLAPPTSHPASGGAVEPDYEGQGYGSGWEAVPRHHHPTRLSDVLEEDERSRTSASQVSRDPR